MAAMTFTEFESLKIGDVIRYYDYAPLMQNIYIVVRRNPTDFGVEYELASMNATSNSFAYLPNLWHRMP